MPKLQLKAQQPQVKVECTADGAGIDDKDVFHAIFKRYPRKEGIKHLAALKAIRAKSMVKDADIEAVEKEAVAELGKHLIQVDITDANGADHKVEGDDLQQLYNSSPYLLELLDTCELALENLKKQEDDRLGNLGILATLLVTDR